MYYFVIKTSHKSHLYTALNLRQSVIKGMFMLRAAMHDPRLGAFFMLTGVTFVAFASGFSACLFDLSQVDACVEVANTWVGKFHEMGKHLIDWAIALVKASFNQHP